MSIGTAAIRPWVPGGWFGGALPAFHLLKRSHEAVVGRWSFGVDTRRHRRASI
jgi:hypothetical protein